MNGVDNLKTNDNVELIQKDGDIIVSKLKKRHLTLEERFEIFNNSSNNEKGNVESYDWGEDLGAEIIG